MATLMTTYTPGSPKPESDREPGNTNPAIPTTETDAVPGASQPLDDTPVPPLTEPADTNGG